MTDRIKTDKQQKWKKKKRKKDKNIKCTPYKAKNNSQIIMQPNTIGLYQVSSRLTRLLQSSVVSCMPGTDNILSCISITSNAQHTHMHTHTHTAVCQLNLLYVVKIWKTRLIKKKLNRRQLIIRRPLWVHKDSPVVWVPETLLSVISQKRRAKEWLNLNWKPEPSPCWKYGK